MPNFRTQKQVHHSADKMFALVADIERYPEFLPMCESLTVRSRKEQDGNVLLVADMGVGYKLVRENFTTQVYLRPKEHLIEVQYIDGPFKYLHNRWQFLPAGGGVQGAADLAAQSGNAATEAQRAGTAAGEGVSPAGLSKAADEGASLDSAGEAADEAASEIADEAADEAASEIADEAADEICIVDFYIDYAFKNPMLSMLMGAMFDIAFRKFTAAFITRADKIYGAPAGA